MYNGSCSVVNNETENMIVDFDVVARGVMLFAALHLCAVKGRSVDEDLESIVSEDNGKMCVIFTSVYHAECCNACATSDILWFCTILLGVRRNRTAATATGTITAVLLRRVPQDAVNLPSMGLVLTA
jgi:hypothetical protein